MKLRFQADNDLDQRIIDAVIRLTIDRVAADEQMKANGVFAEFDHPQLGSVPTVNNPINVNGIAKETPKLAPEIGQHSIEIMSALGYEEGAIEDLERRGVIASHRR